MQNQNEHPKEKKPGDFEGVKARGGYYPPMLPSTMLASHHGTSTCFFSSKVEGAFLDRFSSRFRRYEKQRRGRALRRGVNESRRGGGLYLRRRDANALAKCGHKARALFRSFFRRGPLLLWGAKRRYLKIIHGCKLFGRFYL